MFVEKRQSARSSRAHGSSKQGVRARVVDPAILQAGHQATFPPGAAANRQSTIATTSSTSTTNGASSPRSIFTDGRHGCSSSMPIRTMITCSLDMPAPPNPIIPHAWGCMGNTLPARAAIVHNTLSPIPAIPAQEVAQFPPGNFPFLAFAPDAAWSVNTSMLQAIEFALDYQVIQAPMPLAAPSADPIVLVTQTYVWALIAGDLRNVGFNNPQSCYLILRITCSQVHPRQASSRAERFIMAFTDSILDCACYMLPMAWRSRFSNDWAAVVAVSGNPLRLSWRRGA